MRSSPSSEHAEAVSRRLATLTAELAAVRGEHTHWRGDARAVAAEPEAPAPAAVPEPGRHASRRSGRVPSGPAAERLAALRLRPAHLAVVGVVVSVGLLVTAWVALAGRASPEPLPPAAPAAPLVTGASTSTTEDAPTAATSGAPAQLTVDVAGKVRHPGIVVLPEGSRVVDALDAAGGARGGVDLTPLNLARPLVDGEQILVGVAAPSGPVASAAAGASSAGVPTGPLVDLNTADAATLETLPGVGPVTAEAILTWRAEHGGFTAVEELLEVDGIGDATLAEIAPHVTV